jgi:hypothetical protein
MHADLSARRAAPLPAARPAPDSTFTARARLLRLRDSLTRAAKRVRPPRWNEPPTFFFDRRRQAELEAARPTPPDPFADLTAHVAAELPALFASVEVRRTARAIDLPDAARALAHHCQAARDLADLLAIPDDEVFLALAPAARTGTRLHLHGFADVAQLYRALTPLLPPGPFQLFTPSALRLDGTLPTGLAGCGHWLWPAQPLAAVPRVNGERVVLVGPAVVAPEREADPRFPALAGACEVIQVLNTFQVSALIGELCGASVPVRATGSTGAVARAA